MILKQGHTYRAMPHDGKLIAYIYRGGRCYYIASPYSPEATQALRAAFPQYWTAIRDYGYAHPQLVPFVNEDPMLIVSLVEVGKTRWIVGDGKAAINSGVLMKAGIGVETNIDILESSSLELWGTGNSNQYLTAWALSGNNWRYMKSPISLSLTIPTNGGVHIVQDANGLYLNGEKKGSYNTSGTTSNSIWIFGKDTFAKCRIQYFYMRDDVVTLREMYPFTRNGENGMLDILSGTFHPNANTQGAFTIAITDKAT